MQPAYLRVGEPSTRRAQSELAGGSTGPAYPDLPLTSQASVASAPPSSPHGRRERAWGATHFRGGNWALTPPGRPSPPRSSQPSPTRAAARRLAGGNSADGMAHAEERAPSRCVGFSPSGQPMMATAANSAELEVEAAHARCVILKERITRELDETTILARQLDAHWAAADSLVSVGALLLAQLLEVVPGTPELSLHPASLLADANTERDQFGPDSATAIRAITGRDPDDILRLMTQVCTTGSADDKVAFPPATNSSTLTRSATALLGDLADAASCWPAVCEIATVAGSEGAPGEEGAKLLMSRLADDLAQLGVGCGSAATFQEAALALASLDRTGSLGKNDSVQRAAAATMLLASNARVAEATLRASSAAALQLLSKRGDLSCQADSSSWTLARSVLARSWEQATRTVVCPGDSASLDTDQAHKRAQSLVMLLSVRSRETWIADVQHRLTNLDALLADGEVPPPPAILPEAHNAADLADHRVTTPPQASADTLTESALPAQEARALAMAAVADQSPASASTDSWAAQEQHARQGSPSDAAWRTQLCDDTSPSSPVAIECDPSRMAESKELPALEVLSRVRSLVAEAAVKQQAKALSPAHDDRLPSRKPPRPSEPVGASAPFSDEILPPHDDSAWLELQELWPSVAETELTLASRLRALESLLGAESPTVSDQDAVPRGAQDALPLAPASTLPSSILFRASTGNPSPRARRLAKHREARAPQASPQTSPPVAELPVASAQAVGAWSAGPTSVKPLGRAQSPAGSPQPRGTEVSSAGEFRPDDFATRLPMMSRRRTSSADSISIGSGDGLLDAFPLDLPDASVPLPGSHRGEGVPSKAGSSRQDAAATLIQAWARGVRVRLAFSPDPKREGPESPVPQPHHGSAEAGAPGPHSGPGRAYSLGESLRLVHSLASEASQAAIAVAIRFGRVPLRSASPAGSGRSCDDQTGSVAPGSATGAAQPSHSAAQAHRLPSMLDAATGGAWSQAGVPTNNGASSLPGSDSRLGTRAVASPTRPAPVPHRIGSMGGQVSAALSEVSSAPPSSPSRPQPLEPAHGRSEPGREAQLAHGARPADDVSEHELSPSRAPDEWVLPSRLAQAPKAVSSKPASPPLASRQVAHRQSLPDPARPEPGCGQLASARPPELDQPPAAQLPAMTRRPSLRQARPPAQLPPRATPIAGRRPTGDTSKPRELPGGEAEELQAEAQRQPQSVGAPPVGESHSPTVTMLSSRDAAELQGSAEPGVAVEGPPAVWNSSHAPQGDETPGPKHRQGSYSLVGGVTSAPWSSAAAAVGGTQPLKPPAATQRPGASAAREAAPRRPSRRVQWSAHEALPARDAPAEAWGPQAALKPHVRRLSSKRRTPGSPSPRTRAARPAPRGPGSSAWGWGEGGMTPGSETARQALAGHGPMMRPEDAEMADLLEEAALQQQNADGMSIASSSASGLGRRGRRRTPADA